MKRTELRISNSLRDHISSFGRVEFSRLGYGRDLRIIMEIMKYIASELVNSIP